jgi:hypothetical protein
MFDTPDDVIDEMLQKTFVDSYTIEFPETVDGRQYHYLLFKDGTEDAHAFYEKNRTIFPPNLSFSRGYVCIKRDSKMETFPFFKEVSLHTQEFRCYHDLGRPSIYFNSITYLNKPFGQNNRLVSGNRSFRHGDEEEYVFADFELRQMLPWWNKTPEEEQEYQEEEEEDQNA